MPNVRNNIALNRFELDADGSAACAYYELSAGLITFVHTEVPAELGGRGIGSMLARGSLDAARAQGLRVIAKCPFIKAFIAKHQEYNDLLQ